MQKLFEKQGWHFFALLILLAGVFFGSRLDGFLAGSLWGLPTLFWLWLAVVVPVLHQIFVWLGWRGQLYFGTMTRLFGKKDFSAFSVIFMILFILRPVTLLLVGISNAESLSLSIFWRAGLSLLCLIPSIYLFQSVAHYFGLKRALGIDHFDADYRHLPIVKEGIFRYTDNGMYLFGFLLLWAIGFIFASKAALLAAAFNHLYIWVHFYTVEKPDMDYIYGAQG